MIKQKKTTCKRFAARAWRAPPRPKASTGPFAARRCTAPPMSPDAMMTASRCVPSLQEGDTETAGMFANVEPRLRKLLTDVAERIVTPFTACQAPTRASTNSFAPGGTRTLLPHNHAAR